MIGETDGDGYWDISLNEYPKVKYINVKGKIGSLPKVKAKKGYKFNGWYTKKNGVLRSV